VLAEAADILSDQLRLLLSRLAVDLHGEVARIEARYLKRLTVMGFDERERRALNSLTPGTAVRFLHEGLTPAQFFEEVEYAGRRLAKLNLSPSVIVSSLAEYDRLFTPVLKRRLPSEYADFQWVREQLQFCVLLTLNNSYYQVRETETQAFYEMFWAELHAVTLEDLLGRFLAILARFSRADEASLFLLDGEGRFVCRARFPGGPEEQGSVMERAAKARLRRSLIEPRYEARAGEVILPRERWKGRFACFWSVPMISRDRLAGAIQFAFRQEYRWLPREQDLLTAAAERCVLAADKAQLLESLAAQERQIRRLAEGMMHVEEAERRRISRELHDQTGQDLLYIRLQMEMLERDLPEQESAWRTRLAEVRDMTERTIIEIRRLIGALSPAVLEQLGLAPAIRQLVARFRSNHKGRVRMHLSRLEVMPKQIEVVCYRLVQECLNNVARHSGAENINISVQTADGVVRLIVEDDGAGFDVEEALRKPGSFGLAGIQERVALLGGQCSIQSVPRRPAESRENRGRRRAPGRGRGEGKGRGEGRGKAMRTLPGTQVSIELPIPVTKAEEPAAASENIFGAKVEGGRIYG
jgi:signal transduction histidine kinase